MHTDCTSAAGHRLRPSYWPLTDQPLVIRSADCPIADSVNNSVLYPRQRSGRGGALNSDNISPTTTSSGWSITHRTQDIAVLSTPINLWLNAFFHFKFLLDLRERWWKRISWRKNRQKLTLIGPKSSPRKWIQLDHVLLKLVFKVFLGVSGDKFQ